MPLAIHSFSFKYLSGPTNFALLVPKKEILDNIGLTYVPIIMLLGDTHRDLDPSEVCTDNLNDIATYVPFWFRLLDMIASEGCPVDYFLESFFPPKIFNSLAKDDNYYYLNDKRSLALFRDKTFSPMNIMQELHASCFSTTEYGKNKCITSNIRYHFTDLRLDREYINLSEEDKQKVHIMYQKMHENLPLRTAFEEAKAHLDNKEAFQGYYIPLLYSEQELEGFETPISIKGATIYYGTFEHHLIHALHRCIGSFNISFGSLRTTFHDTDCLQLLHDILNTPENFIPTIMNMEQFKTQSLLGKQMLDKSNKEELYGPYKKLFKEYFEFYYEHIIRQNPQFMRIRQVVNRFYKHRHLLSILYKREPTRKEKDEIQDVEDKIEEIQDRYAYDSIGGKDLITDITMPFIDLYFLFRSWKQSPMSCLSVFNAGALHTHTLANFLKDKYYTLVYAAGDSFDSMKVTTINYKHKREEGKIVLKADESKLSLCIPILKKIDLVALIQANMEKHPDMLRIFNDKVQVVHDREAVLGSELFAHMLNGFTISSENILAKQSEYKEKYGHVPDLRLSHVVLPEEYKAKRTI